jgi:hypothetical protein
MIKPGLLDSISLLINPTKAFSLFIIANVPVRFTNSFPFLTPAFKTLAFPVIDGHRFILY